MVLFRHAVCLPDERLTERYETGDRGRQGERSQPVHLDCESILNPGPEVFSSVDLRALAEPRTNTILDLRQAILVDSQEDTLLPGDGAAVALVVRRSDDEDWVRGVRHILGRASDTHERDLLGGAGRRGDVPGTLTRRLLLRGERDERKAIADVGVERVPHGFVDEELIRPTLVVPTALDDEEGINGIIACHDRKGEGDRVPPSQRPPVGGGDDEADLVH